MKRRHANQPPNGPDPTRTAHRSSTQWPHNERHQRVRGFGAPQPKRANGPSRPRRDLPPVGSSTRPLHRCHWPVGPRTRQPPRQQSPSQPVLRHVRVQKSRDLSKHGIPPRRGRAAQVLLHLLELRATPANLGRWFRRTRIQNRGYS